MDPERDCDYLAEASPRELLVAPADLFTPRSDATPSPGDAAELSLTPFLESSVRCMRYRSYIRWFHGSFSAGASTSKLILHMLVALLILLTSFFILCIDSPIVQWSTLAHPHFAMWNKLVLYTAVAIPLSILLFLLLAQTPRVALYSIWISRLLIMLTIIQVSIASIRKVSSGHTRCPSSMQQLRLPILIAAYASLQLTFAFLALFIECLATPLARWYILKSTLFLYTWGAEIVELTKQRVTVRACPFDCHGRNWKVYRHFSLTLKFFRTGRFTVFSPTDLFLPENIRTSPVKPCCPYCSIYVGQVDQLVRPHGQGAWSQGWAFRFGEYLNGSWEFGRPVAPFMSRQNVCGSGFTALRFGWVKFDFTTPDSTAQVYAGEKDNQTSDEALNDTNLEFGLLDVECSIFGKFFRKFPKYIYWKAPAAELQRGNLNTSARPALGLNNRLSSFSYLDTEPASKRLLRRRSTFFTEAKAGLSAATALYVPGSSTRNSHSFSDADHTDSPCEGVIEDHCTRRTALNGIRWVVDRMLPFHIPMSPSEENEERNLRVTIDKHNGLQPHGWMPASSSVAASRRHSCRVMSRVKEDEFDTSPLSRNEQAFNTKLIIETVAARQNISLKSTSVEPGDFAWTPVGDIRTRELEIAVRGWKKFGGCDSDNLEAMVFIHGYKTPLTEAPLLLGQLIALGGFPNRIKPFMFLWPAGTQVWHYYQARRASRHYLCCRGLVLFLKSLAQKRVRNVHILAHSMGSRLFMNSLRYAFKEKLFIPNHEKHLVDHYNVGQLNLQNLVFLHPEHYLTDFVHHGGYDLVKTVADHVTIYCHSHDEALLSAEILSRGQKCMGRWPFGYVRQRLRGGSTSSASEDDTQSSFSLSVPDRFSPLPRTRPDSAVPSPHSSQDELDYEWLDVDVIDCTYLDANVHDLRHCFFNINASVVGDIRDMLTQGTSAGQRHQTLENREGNVFTFRVPPAELTSIFGV